MEHGTEAWSRWRRQQREREDVERCLRSSQSLGAVALTPGLTFLSRPSVKTRWYRRAPLRLNTHERGGVALCARAGTGRGQKLHTGTLHLWERHTHGTASYQP